MQHHLAEIGARARQRQQDRHALSRRPGASWRAGAQRYGWSAVAAKAPRSIATISATTGREC
jgi:hypothetical protein